MKSTHVLAAVAVALGLAGAPVLTPTPAHAIGCLSGGAAGAVAGHYAGHHGVLGAIGGCIAGHQAHKMQMRKRAEERAMRNQPTPTPSATTY